MNKDAFTGRAHAYVNALPGYASYFIEYFRELAPREAVIADIGAGTGIFTAQLARDGYDNIYAVEPNADMREQLAVTLRPFSSIKIINGTAEATTLADRSVDVITNAQALNRFDINKFRAECARISIRDPYVITVYNDDEITADYKGSERYKKSAGALYKKPAVRMFPNPVYFSRDKWLQYFLSMEGVPMEGDAGYESFAAELNERFDRNNTGGTLCLNLTTVVFSGYL